MESAENGMAAKMGGADVHASSSKFSDILRFLEEANQADDEIRSIGVASSINASRCGSVMAAETVASTMRTKIEKLTAKLNDREQALTEAKRKLAEVKAKELRRKEQTQKALQDQKDEFESVALRNMDFIKSLLVDKENLTKRIDALCGELKTVEEKHQKRLADADERLKSELNTQKQQFEKSDRRRRAQWVEEHTKKIKEDALKALEPEISQLMNKHRQEKCRLEEEKITELRKKDAAIAQKEAEMMDLRRRLDAEREIECKRKDALLQDKEREIFDQRTRLSREYEQSLLRERELFHQQNKEMCDRFERQLDEQRRLLRESKEREEEMRFRLDQELASEKAKLQVEKGSKITLAESEIRLQMQAEFGLKEKALRERMEAENEKFKEQLKMERDKEIELVIRKLEGAALDVQKDFKTKDRSLNERIKQLEKEKDALMAELEDERRKRVDTETLLDMKKKRLEELEAQLKEVRGECDARIQTVTQELTHKLQQTDHIWSAKHSNRIQEHEELIEHQSRRILELQTKLDAQERSHQTKLEQAATQSTKELDLLELRFQQTLAKKDKVIVELTNALQTAEARVREIEDVFAAHQNEPLAHSVPPPGEGQDVDDDDEDGEDDLSQISIPRLNLDLSQLPPPTASSASQQSKRAEGLKGKATVKKVCVGKAHNVSSVTTTSSSALNNVSNLRGSQKRQSVQSRETDTIL